MRVRKNYSKTTALFPWYIVEACLITFAEFTGNVQAKAGTFIFCCIKRFEKLALFFHCNAGSIIHYFQNGQFSLWVAVQVQPNLAQGIFFAAVTKAIFH